MEQWRQIEFTNGEYSVSNHGRVKRNKTGRILSNTDNGTGYRTVALFRTDRTKHYKVHRLVAEAFIPNEDRLPVVNHIDGDKGNNRVENLEWVTVQGNSIHAHRTGLMDRQHEWCDSKKKAIIATNIYTGEEKLFDSILSAKRAIKSNHIQSVLNGERTMAKGFTFRYANGGDALCQH